MSGPPRRVLVVDDSVVVRRLISTLVDEDPALESCGTAPNGRIALAKIERARPDVVTLDLEMPEMDGLETLAELRRLDPDLPVLVLSSQTERGARVTLDALAGGARDYVSKPAGLKRESALATLRAELIPRLIALAGGAGSAPATAAPPPRAAAPPARSEPIRLVAIGASTGGPNVLTELIPALPRELPAAVLVVVHMPAVFTRQFAERLDRRAALEVREAEEGGEVRPGTAWVAAGGRHMLVGRRPSGPGVTLRLADDPPEHGCRPAVDPLLRSVARVYGRSALGVILTGMGRDGHLGCQALRAAGGRVLAQDEASSVVWGMPGYVARAGLADAVLPADVLATTITERVLASHRAPARARDRRR